MDVLFCYVRLTVRLTDTTPPTITCPADTTSYVRSGTTSTPVQFNSATASDNSGGQVTITYRTTANPNVNVDPGSLFSTGRTTVTATATDPSGNSQQCNFDVTVTGTSLIKIMLLFTFWYLK